MNLFKSQPETAYIGLGSNLGDRAGNLLLAVRCLIEASLCVNRLSSIYETEPVDMESANKFLNMVAEVEVRGFTASQMMARLLRIEYSLGRGEKSAKTARTIDLDILFLGNVQIESDLLTIPHPRLHLRKFVLCPLSEIAPNFVHPVLGSKIIEILGSVDDPCEVKRWNPNLNIPRESVAIT